MNIALVLFSYFPYGGLQRDFLRIARACLERGAKVRVFCMSWQGEGLPGLQVTIPRIKGLTAPTRRGNFIAFLQEQMAENAFDAVLGFNKMPGLDFYFAADRCFATRAFQERSWLYRLTPRCRQYLAFERAVFSPQSGPVVFMLSPSQRQEYIDCYGIAPERLLDLPPGIDRNRMADACRQPDQGNGASSPSTASPPISSGKGLSGGQPAPDHQLPSMASAPINGSSSKANQEDNLMRRRFREEFALRDDDLLALQIGSGFAAKGVDRSLRAVAALPPKLRSKTRFFVVGQGKSAPYRRLAKKLGLGESVRFFSGRDDIPRFLQGADLLLHPAYRESAGMVLVEAVVAGLPVLTTDACGYAFHVTAAEAGRVCASPFQQRELNRLLAEMLESPMRPLWRTKGIEYGRSADLYDMPAKVAEIVLNV